MRSGSRIKEFQLSDAIIYSYAKDIRFVLLLCLSLGFSLFWLHAPELVILNPPSLCSPDFELLQSVVQDTFINNLCSIHQESCPCECGEPLNRAARDLFTEEPQFDPLELKRKKIVKASATYFAAIFLSIALTESISYLGILPS